MRYFFWRVHVFVLGVMGVLTNSLVMRVFLKDGVLASPKNILHINLAFANILVVAGFPFSGLSCFHGRYVSLNVYTQAVYRLGSSTSLIVYTGVGYISAIFDFFSMFRVWFPNFNLWISNFVLWISNFILWISNWILWICNIL